MARVKVVTGFIPIPGHPRSENEFIDLGRPLVELSLKNPIYWGRGTVLDTWLARYIDQKGMVPNNAFGDNPAKNSLAYHCVQHEKFAWLHKAIKDDPADVYVWIDFGILHVPGVTVAVIRDFLDRVQDFGVVQLPGCWGATPGIRDDYPCWRFCGGVQVVPASLVHQYSLLMIQTAGERLLKTNMATWEVNTMAHAEQVALRPEHMVPMVWYQADHDHTMFSNYMNTPPKVVPPCQP